MEHTLIFDNLAELEEINRAEAKVVKKMQKKLLKKVGKVQNQYSLYLFLVDHLVNWDLTNCIGMQDYGHICNFEENPGEEKNLMVCGCQDSLLRC